MFRGDCLTQGPSIEQFEGSAAPYVGANYAVAYSSGTSALHGAAAAAGLGPCDVVDTSPLTFMASANAAHCVGAQPMLMDTRKDTWSIDMSTVPQGVNAFIPILYAGPPVDLTKRQKKAQIVVEDTVHALRPSLQMAQLAIVHIATCSVSHFIP